MSDIAKLCGLIPEERFEQPILAPTVQLEENYSCSYTSVPQVAKSMARRTVLLVALTSTTSHLSDLINLINLVHRALTSLTL